MMHTLRKLTVKDAFRLDDEDPVVLKLTDEFRLVIANFSRRAERWGIFVVDDENRFSGVITRTDLLDWARVSLGAVLLKPLPDTDKTIRLANLISASTVRDILRPETRNAAVLANDTLAQALQRMIESELTILPVIDESLRILGSLTLSEILNQVHGLSQENP